MKLEKKIYLGKSRRKTTEVIFGASEARKKDLYYIVDVSISGFAEEHNRSLTRCIEIERREKEEESPRYTSITHTVSGHTEFDTISSAIAYFRGHLHLYFDETATQKIYVDLNEGKLEEISFFELFPFTNF